MKNLFSVATYRFNNTLQFENMYDAHACLELAKPRGNDIPSGFTDGLFLILSRCVSVQANKNIRNNKDKRNYIYGKNYFAGSRLSKGFKKQFFFNEQNPFSPKKLNPM